MTVPVAGRPEAPRACEGCLRRSWLLTALAGHLARTGSRLPDLLALDDLSLLEAVAGRSRADLERRLARFDADGARRRAAQARVEMICRCQADYPVRLRSLVSPPAVLHVSGGLAHFLELIAGEPVAVVGTRRPSSYGLEVSRALARGLGASGVPVLSGMAFGIDSAAHEGTLAVGGPTVAILPAGVERAHPASRRALHRRIVSCGVAVSELPPGTDVWRWMFPARNRLIAALAALTVVVEAPERSGALLTACWAQTLGRPVGAVPGRITATQAGGPHRLLAQGAHLITGVQDILDLLYGAGARTASPDARPQPDPELRPWLRAIAEGHDTAASLTRLGLAPEQSLQVLSALELSGHIRRQPGGRFAVVP